MTKEWICSILVSGKCRIQFATRRPAKQSEICLSSSRKISGIFP